MSKHAFEGRMGRLDRLRDAQREAQLAAWQRYEARAATRTHNKALVSKDGVGAADTPSRRAQYAKRLANLEISRALRRLGGLPIGIERRMGATLDLEEYAPNDIARRVGRSVCRIVSQSAPDIEPVGFGTGFLIAPDLLITNWHVFPDAADARDCGANFLYEQSDKGLSRGVTFTIDPDRFYVNDKQLDFAVVAVAPRSTGGRLLSDLGQNSLIEARPKILIGEAVNIIQHPEGGPKRYAIAENRLVDILEEEGFLHYETDTLEGSSGSPAFSRNWEIVALHHAAIPKMRGRDILTRDGTVWRRSMGDDAVYWIANEGIRVSAIVKKLSEIDPGSDTKRDILQQLLASTTDPAAEAAESAPAYGAEAAVSKLIQQTLPSAPRGTTTMAPVNLTFTGPVTINIVTDQTAPIVAEKSSPEPLKAPEKSIRFDTNYDKKPGFAGDFLATDEERKKRSAPADLIVPLPKVSSERLSEIFTRAGTADPYVLKYHHFSIVMNKVRRLQMWSAGNVDYNPAYKSTVKREEWGRDRWITDPRIPEKFQITDPDFYKPATSIDRGHIIRREDNEWHEVEELREFANSDTFHWTNCTPQHEAFNQAGPRGPEYRGVEGVWGAFENHIQKSRQGDDTKASILAGPILAADDPSTDYGRGPVQYPLRFWKIVCVVEPDDAGDRKLKAFGFILDQTDIIAQFGIERFGPGRFAPLQVPLSEIEAAAGVEFGTLNNCDVMKGQSSVRLARPEQMRRY